MLKCSGSGHFPHTIGKLSGELAQSCIPCVIGIKPFAIKANISLKHLESMLILSVLLITHGAENSKYFLF